MKLRSLVFSFLFLFLMVGVSAQGTICIDFDTPDNPSNFQNVVRGNDVTLNWDVVIDEPSCSGILEYKIYRDGLEIGSTSNLSFEDLELASGDYSYEVSAVDLANHESFRSQISVTIGGSSGSSGSSGGSGGGGGGSSGGGNNNGFCGDGICSENELLSCPSDCGSSVNNLGLDGGQSFGSEFGETSEEKGGFSSSGITGNVIGGFSDLSKGQKSALVLVILILILLGLISSVARKRE